MIADLPLETDATILVIDIGGTHIKFGYVVALKPQSFTQLVPTSHIRTRNPVDVLVMLARDIMQQIGLRPDAIVCTVPGFLAKDGDLLLHLANLPELDGHRLATELSAPLGIPVFLERDSNLALLGESMAGSAKSASTVLGLFFGTGIGASLLVDGMPFRGGGWALEVGHARVFDETIMGNELRYPSAEDCASGRALQGIADRHHVPVQQVFFPGPSPELAADLDRLVRHQALVVTSTMAAVSPDTVVVGGGVLDMVGYPLERFLAVVAANALCPAGGAVLDIRRATLGWSSVLHGAPSVVRQHAMRFAAPC